MCVTQAHCVWLTFLLVVRRVSVLSSVAIRGTVVPDDEIEPLTRCNVIGTVSLATKVPHATSQFMVEGVGMLPVIRGTHDSAKAEASPSKGPAQTEVEGNIRVICVHVKAKVFTLLVPHNERVMTVERCYMGPMAAGNLRKNIVLQIVDHGSPANLVENNTVIVHGVWASGWQPTRGKVVNLLNKKIAKGLAEHLA